MNNKPFQKTVEELQAEALALEIEERKQALESKKLQDELARIQLDEKKQELQTKKDQKVRGKADAEKAMRDRQAVQDICNHRQGGRGADGAVRNGQGDTRQPPCVGGIQFLDDSYMVCCVRCHQEWRSTDAPEYWMEGFKLFQESGLRLGVVGGPKVIKTIAA
jgi:hypothetical protein